MRILDLSTRKMPPITDARDPRIDYDRVDFQKIRATIKEKEKCSSFLLKAGHGGYICPRCGSGTGTHKTGGVKFYPETNTWFCHVCRSGGDVIDLMPEMNRAENLIQWAIDHNILDQVARIWSYPAPGGAQKAEESEPDSKEKVPDVAAPSTPARTEPEPMKTSADFRKYYVECIKNLEKSKDAQRYIVGRGISLETAKKFYIGYDPAADPAGAGYPTPRLIIPTSRSHYIGRRIDGSSKYPKLNVKGGSPGVAYIYAAQKSDAQIIFVCEGVFDAMTIVEAGGMAVSINSANNWPRAVNELLTLPRSSRLLICLDADEAGKAAAEELKNKLLEAGVEAAVLDLSRWIRKGEKDLNEIWIRDKAAVIDILSNGWSYAIENNK